MNTPNSLHKDRKALWFTLLPIVLTVLLLAAVAAKQQLFAVSDRLFVFADSGTGIAVGMPVKIQGFNVGSVKELGLHQPDGGTQPKVRITLEVHREAMRYIAKDSLVRLGQEGLIGQGLLEIVPGKERARRAASGDVLEFERSRSLGEIADGLAARARPVLDNVEALTRSLSDPAGDLQQTLHASRTLVEGAGTAVGAIDSLARQGERTIAKLGEQAETVTRSANGLVTDIRGSVPKIDEVLAHAVASGRHIEQTTARAAAIVDQGSQVVDDASRTVNGALRSWPFSMWTPAQPDPVIPVGRAAGAVFLEPAQAAERVR